MVGVEDEGELEYGEIGKMEMSPEADMTRPMCVKEWPRFERFESDLSERERIGRIRNDLEDENEWMNVWRPKTEAQDTEQEKQQ